MKHLTFLEILKIVKWEVRKGRISFRKIMRKIRSIDNWFDQQAGWAKSAEEVNAYVKEKYLDKMTDEQIQKFIDTGKL